MLQSSSPHRDCHAEWERRGTFFWPYLEMLLDLDCASATASANPATASLQHLAASGKSKSASRGRRSVPVKKDELLYADVLYTITHQVGSGSETAILQSLYVYSRAAFGMSDTEHNRLMLKVVQDKAPRTVLCVTVLEARGLEPKDPAGFSDPYCMLTVVPFEPAPSFTPTQTQTQTQTQTPEEDRDTVVGLRKMSPKRRISSVEKSPANSPNPLKRFSESVRTKCDKMRSRSATGRNAQAQPPTSRRAAQINAPVSTCSSPATSVKDLRLPQQQVVIKATSVKQRTTTPNWSETFKLEVGDAAGDTLHLDVWDHDDDSDVADILQRLNAARLADANGAYRYFKPIRQSARRKASADTDDFMGSVDVKIAHIPADGCDSWYKLEGRSARSAAQGEIRLRLLLGTRRARRMTQEQEDDLDFKQHERMLSIFTDYELKNRPLTATSEVTLWNGVLSNAAETVLQQHKLQCGLSDLQETLCRWLVYSRLTPDQPFDYHVLFNLLLKMDELFKPGLFSKSELEALQNSFTMFTRCAVDVLTEVANQFPLVGPERCESVGMSSASSRTSRQSPRSSQGSASDRDALSGASTPTPIRRAPLHLTVGAELLHGRSHLALTVRRSAPLSPIDGPTAAHGRARAEQNDEDVKPVRRSSDLPPPSQSSPEVDPKKASLNLQNLTHYLRALAYLHKMDLFSYGATYTDQLQSDLTEAVKRQVDTLVEKLDVSSSPLTPSADAALRSLQQMCGFLEALSYALTTSRKYDEIFQRETGFKYFSTFHRFVLRATSTKIDARLQASLNACCNVLHAAVPSSTVNVLSLLSARVCSPRTSRAHTPVSVASASLATGSPDRPAALSACATPVGQGPLNNLRVPHSSDPAVDRSEQQAVLADECLLAHFRTIIKTYLALRRVATCGSMEEVREDVAHCEGALQWFAPAILLWLSDLRRKLDAYAITVADLFCVAPKRHVRTLANMYSDICEFWKSLLLHDMHGRLSFVFTITEILSDKAVRYAALLQERLQNQDSCANSIEMGCAALNSIESMQQILYRLDEMLQFNLLYGKLVQQLQNEQQAKMTSNGLYELINNALAKIDLSIGFIANNVTAKLQPDIKKYVFNVFWAPRSMLPEAASSSLLNFAKVTAAQFQAELQGISLVRMLCGFLHQMLSHFHEQVEKEAAEMGNSYQGETQVSPLTKGPSSPKASASTVPPTFLRVADSATLNSLVLSPVTGRRSIGSQPTNSSVSNSRMRDSAYSSEHASVSASVTNSIGPAGGYNTHSSISQLSPSPSVFPGNTPTEAPNSAATQEAVQTVSVICARLAVAVRMIFEHLHSVCDKAAANGGEMLKTELYRRMVQLLYLHQLPTISVIEEYMEEMAQIQASTKESKYGQLTVRVVYKTGQSKLCVQMLHAKDLVPLDPNGLSDPFVIVELGPPHLFPNVQRFQTSIVKRTLNPVFEETFEIPVDVQLCRARGAIILFTIMDYDMIFKNDFGGESCVLLRDVPGVNEAELSGFQSLKPVTLPVLHLKAQSVAIHVLSQRKYDRYAQDFARRRNAIALQSFGAPTTSRQKSMMYL